jgi:uncharacterized membrane protein
MGKIERRVLAAALAGAITMFGVVGFLRSEPETTPAQSVPVSVTAPHLAGLAVVRVR